MKPWIVFILLLTGIVQAATGGAGHPKSTSINTNTNKIGPSYGETNGQAFPNSTVVDIGGMSFFALYNGSSLGSIGVTFPKGNETCSSVGASYHNSKEFTVPASTGFTPPKPVFIGKYACLRSKTGSSLTSGPVDLTLW